MKAYTKPFISNIIMEKSVMPIVAAAVTGFAAGTSMGLAMEIYMVLKLYQ